MTILRTAAVAALLTLVVAAPAVAQGTLLAEAAEGLRESNVYVAPGVQSELPVEDETDLEALIAAAEVGPVYLAVLPEEALAEAGGSLDAALRLLGEDLDRPGTYGLVAGGDFRAGATGGTPFVEGEVPQAADAAAAEADGDVATLLATFIEELDAAADASATAADSADSGGGGATVFIWLLVAAAVAVGVWLLVRRRRKQREEAAQLAEVRRVAEEDVTALADAIIQLEPEVTIAPDPRAEGAYADASRHYTQGRDLLAAARRPQDLQAVTQELEEGRYAVARTRAALAGEPDPEHRPPCFFDPRHGPSTRDVEWSPPGGEPRAVPACEADALHVDRDEEPDVRQLELAGGRRPYYDAPPYYGGWMGGFYGGFGGLGFLNGLLLGQLLVGPGWGFGGYGMGGGYAGDGGGGDTGFGGGDFGGGGFGGGDFGGGDFGGGDF